MLVGALIKKFDHFLNTPRSNHKASKLKTAPTLKCKAEGRCVKVLKEEEKEIYFCNVARRCGHGATSTSLGSG
jgi:hypothetical protein